MEHTPETLKGYTITTTHGWRYYADQVLSESERWVTCQGARVTKTGRIYKHREDQSLKRRFSIMKSAIVDTTEGMPV